MNQIKKLFVILLVLSLAFSLTACSVKKIADVKSDDLVDTKVAVRGTVEGTTKIGTFSGYTVRDETGTIGIVSDDLPKEGSTVTAKGTLKKLLVVYYIDSNE